MKMQAVTKEAGGGPVAETGEPVPAPDNATVS
jgi:hypothetical protein